MYEVIRVSIFDRMNGVKVGMKCYVRGIQYEYKGVKVYTVDIIDYVNKRADGSGFYLLAEDQLKRIE